MGWVESPAYFCAASETGRDVASYYAETALGTLSKHKFLEYQLEKDYKSLSATTDDDFRYFNEVYVDDYMSIALITSRQQLDHVSSALMHGIHDVFPPDDNDEQDSMSLKKQKKGDEALALLGDQLDFVFNGNVGPKTLWLDEDKRDKILVIL
jgi:hypothetical protein